MKDLPNSALEFILSLIPRDPEKALASLLPKLRYVEVRPVAKPSAEQIKLLRTLDPYTGCGIGDIKQKLIAGAIRLGPLHRAIGSGGIRRKLESVGLEVIVRPLTQGELKEAKFADDRLPPYFQAPPSDQK